eukprot:354588-Hanusia_phi.AAC.1
MTRQQEGGRRLCCASPCREKTRDTRRRLHELVRGKNAVQGERGEMVEKEKGSRKRKRREEGER